MKYRVVISEARRVHLAVAGRDRALCGYKVVASAVGQPWSPFLCTLCHQLATKDKEAA